MDRPAEVCDLEFSSEAQQKVFWFNVSVDHLLFVTVVKSVGQLLHVLETHEISVNISDAQQTITGARLITHGGGALIIEASAALELFVHLAARRVLQNQIHTRVVVEVVVELQDVWMPVHTHTPGSPHEPLLQEQEVTAAHLTKLKHTPEVRLDLDFSPQLMFDSFLLHLRLEQNLQSHDDLQLPVSCEVNVTKLPLSERTADVEVFNGEFSGTAVINKH